MHSKFLIVCGKQQKSSEKSMLNILCLISQYFPPLSSAVVSVVSVSLKFHVVNLTRLINCSFVKKTFQFWLSS